MTVGDAILSLVDKIVSRKKLSVILIVLINIIGTFIEVKLNLSNIFSIKSINFWNIIQCSLLIYYVDIHMVGRVGFTACSISYIKKVCVFTGTHTITSLTVGIKHFYL